MKKCVVIYNPESGRKKLFNQDTINKMQEILKEHDYESIFYKSRYSGSVTNIVKKLLDDTDLVISIGGDGTFSESIKGNYKREKKLLLSHIPTGTTNDIGKMYGYTTDLLTNLSLLLEGEVKEVDVCTLNDEPFAYVAGFGKFMNIPYETTRESKKTLGYLAYIKKGLQEVIQRVKLYELSYETNGEVHSGNYSVMLATNSTRVAGFKSIYNNIKLNDGKFEVLFCTIKKKKSFLKSLILLKTTDISNLDGLSYHRTNKLVIHNPRGKTIVWDVDGEKKEIKAKDITIATTKSLFLIPKTNIDELFD